jgi:predicted NBD/HSP70 family sugar kinase
MYIALDIGGTKFMAASADEKLKILKRLKEPTPADLDQGIELLHRMIAEISEDSPIAGMGAAIGGPLDWQKGIVSPLHQPAWRDVPFKEIMEKKWKCPFRVDVDTNVAALGEYHLGGYKAERLMYITLSTGMGGGFIVNGAIYRGRGGEHPEMGHQSINYKCSNPRGIQCECGVPDCLEALVSGNGIRSIYGKPAQDLDENEWDEVAYNLGQGLRNIAVMYMPDVIVLGGGVALGGGEILVESASSVMKEHLKIVPAPEVRLSKLGYDTALIGAAVLAKTGFN